MAHSAFDSVLDKKVGFGRYQHIAFLFIGLTQFSDGSEIVALSILLPVLKTEWGITDDQQGMLGSVLFLGILAGSLLGGWVSDKLGRRPALLYGSIVQFIVGVLSTMVTNIYLFILVRSIFGVCIGFTIPLAPSLASEITPVELRGRGIVAINFFFSLGKFFAVLVAMACLDTINTGNWRAMLIWCSMPSLAVFFGALFYLKESPRLLIAVGRVEEGVEVLNFMAATNKPEERPTISDEEIEELQDWQRQLFAAAEPANIKTLFSEKYKQITTLLWGMWFTLNISFYGMIFILPFILSELNTGSSSTTGLNGMLLTIAGEVPSILVSLYIVEKEAFGRKGTILYANIGAAVTFFVAYVGPVSWLIPLLTVGRFFLKMNFAMIYPLTTELYPTIIRTAGMGFASGVGRLGASVMPYLLLALMKVSTLFPVFGFAVLAAMHGCTAYMLPYDTRGVQLDLLINKGEEESGLTRKTSNALVKL